MAVEMPPTSLPVRVSAQNLAACVDILLENVFAHTPEGTALSVRVSPRAAGSPWVVVSDNGPGFPHADPARRGMSSAGSTGLGLDIADSRPVAALRGRGHHRTWVRRISRTKIATAHQNAAAVSRA
ncbi:MAG TPA: ATP-binding protein [Streptosporangiaceae bacterium]|jgi:signal transduction histidine kinase|nr:ATP-binding protein [Streptosporangiaceae bacterium]